MWSMWLQVGNTNGDGEKLGWWVVFKTGLGCSQDRLVVFNPKLGMLSSAENANGGNKIKRQNFGCLGTRKEATHVAVQFWFVAFSRFCHGTLTCIFSPPLTPSECKIGRSFIVEIPKVEHRLREEWDSLTVEYYHVIE